jgi:hypothetical protein
MDEELAARKRLAEAVRRACLEAARKGYEDAAMSGICHEGAVELSLDAILGLDITPLLQASENSGKKPR